MDKMKKENRDVGYHYEELTGSRKFKYGIWDVPGSKAMRRIWPMFYRYVKISAVIFMIDGSRVTEDIDDIARIEEA